MSGGLLLLSYHTGTLFREDLLFKQAAMDKHELAAPLITRDILAEQKPPSSLISVDSSGGLAQAGHKGVNAWTLGKLMARTWRRKGFKPPAQGKPSDFETWFASVLSKPAELIVTAGHHGGAGARSAIFWGDEYTGSEGEHFPQSGIATRFSDDGKPLFTVTAFKRAAPDAATTTAFDASQAVSACRLVIVLGCTGVNNGAKWQSWVRAGHPGGKRPLVLGWFGTHTMPKEKDPNFSPLFWKEMYAAAKASGSTTLSELIDKDAKAVVGAWGKALKATYYKKESRRAHLWYLVDPADGKEGAGAFTPDGTEWRVKSADGDIEPV